MWQVSNIQKVHLLQSAFHAIAAESNQHENNPFRVVTHITLKWNATLTLGIRVACNWAGVQVFKWHHLVSFQLVHTIGGFMITETWAKAILRVIQTDLLQQIHQLFSLLIIESRYSSQELTNMESCGHMGNLFFLSFFFFGLTPIMLASFIMQWWSGYKESLQY